MTIDPPPFVGGFSLEREGELWGMLPQVVPAARPKVYDRVLMGNGGLAMIVVTPPGTVGLHLVGETHSMSLKHLWDKVGSELQFSVNLSCRVVAEGVAVRDQLPLEMRLSSDSFRNPWEEGVGQGIALSLEFYSTWFPDFVIDLVQLYRADCEFPEARQVQSECLLVNEGRCLATYLDGIRWSRAS